MIGINWSTRTEGPCPTCHQPVIVKKKNLTFFGIPIPLGSPARTCGCAQGAVPPQQQMAPQPQMAQQQQMAPPPQATPSYPCPQCRATLQWAAQYQRWFCPTCQQYR